MTDNAFNPLTGDELKLDPAKPERERDPRPFVRSSHDAPEPKPRRLSGWRHVTAYMYPDADGAPSLYRERFESLDGSGRKFFLAQSLRRNPNDLVEWVHEDFPPGEPRPLFNLPAIVAAPPDQEISLHEGEKATIAMGEIYDGTIIATTHAGGANGLYRDGVLGHDLTPLAGHPVRLWADNDESGKKWRDDLVPELIKLGCTLCEVDGAALAVIDGGKRGPDYDAKGWDAADMLAEWSDPEARRAAIDEHTRPIRTKDPEERDFQQELDDLRVELQKADPKNRRLLQSLLDKAAAYEWEPAYALDFQREAAKHFGVDKRTVDNSWRRAEKTAERERARKAAERIVRENTEREARERAEREAEERREFENCKDILASPDILQQFVDFAHASGIVREDQPLKGALLQTVARLLKQRGLAVIVLGPSGSGKNTILFALETVPWAKRDISTGGSTQSVLYYGGDDPDALCHQIVYAAEFAAFMLPNGEEKQQTGYLRTIISEGRICHPVTTPGAEPGETPVTKEIVKNGPISFVSTTARDNVDKEMQTRMLPLDADESREQTKLILEKTLERAGSKIDVVIEEARLQKWRDLQMHLERGGPYRVLLPFWNAFSRALDERYPVDTPLLLRIRRDLVNFIQATRASAVLHRYNRQFDGDFLVATMEDYAIVHAIFDPPLAHLYELPIIDIPLIELVGALERAGVPLAEKDEQGRLKSYPKTLSIRELERWLPYKGNHDRTFTRLDALAAAGLLQIRKSQKPKSPHSYLLLQSSAALKANPDGGVRLSVFPTPEQVEDCLRRSMSAASVKNAENQNGDRTPGATGTPWDPSGTSWDPSGTSADSTANVLNNNEFSENSVVWDRWDPNFGGETPTPKKISSPPTEDGVLDSDIFRKGGLPPENAVPEVPDAQDRQNTVAHQSVIYSAAEVPGDMGSVPEVPDEAGPPRPEISENHKKSVTLSGRRNSPPALARLTPARIPYPRKSS